MKRLLIGCGLAAVVVAVGLGAGPVWTGAVAERHHARALEALEGEAQVRVRSSEYDRGFFGATSRVEVEFIGPVADEFASFMEWEFGVRQAPVLVFHDRISHGPIPSGSGGVPGAAFVASRVEVAEQIGESLPMFADDPTVMTAETRVGFDGASRTTFATPGWDVEGDDAAFSFSGLNGTFRMDADMVGGEIDMNFDRLAVTELGTTWSAQGVRFHSEPEDLGAVVWTGDSVLEIDTVGVDDAEIEGVRVASWAGIDDGAFDITLDATMHAMVADGYRIEESRLKAALYRIDQEALEQVVELTDQLEMGHIDDYTMGMRLFALLPQLLEREPELVIEELSVAMPEGPVQASARVTWDGRAPSLENPLAAVDGLFAEVQVNASREAVHRSVRAYVRQDLASDMLMRGQSLSEEAVDERANQLASERVNEMVSGGLFQLDGQDLQGHVLIEDGLVLVNGKNYGPVWGLLAP
ncbi:YdgA family protein [Aquisalimonas asiatica]|uniref:Uncharacterized conserved protein YdgA, DUF945 family n=1 Tax=Aquisalimonas asiatica TaxID=406100 RepID=A0A1H8VNY9_9GAMM|nr:YdgA family protein [Aquisalimonas asiatica]SEP17044.1 Uncharacterized conserved protein YdgA, DUF945 family [Aquisalimonas asiatica]